MKILIQFLTFTLSTTCLLSKAPALLINQLVGEITAKPGEKANNGPAAIALLNFAPAKAQQNLRNSIKRVLYDNDEGAFQKALKAASPAQVSDPVFAQKLAAAGSDKVKAKTVLEGMFNEDGSAFNAMKAVSEKESAEKAAAACQRLIHETL
jgi:hypothetical protein